MADAGGSLDEVCRVAEKANRNVHTVGVAASPCVIPEVGRPSFEIGEGEMEFGMGIHGEPGILRQPLRPVEEIVSDMLALHSGRNGRRSRRRGLRSGERAGGHLTGGTLHRVPQRRAILEDKGISIFSSYVGEFATSMEMSGFSLSLLKLDGELKELLRREAHTPFFTQNAG